MTESIQKAFFGLIALGVCCIAVELVPVSRQATSWNRCWETHKKFLSTLPALQGMDDKGVDPMSVAMSNGADYESSKTKKK